MGIRWYSEQQAETDFEDTLSDWAKNQGYKGCYSADETRKAVWSGLGWAKRSGTAKQIMEYVLLHPKDVIVVGMRGGFQCFNSTEGRKGDMPVIYIDLDGQLTTIVRGPHNLHLDPGKCSGAVAMDNRIAMLHEFGHAKQWMERPSLFDNQSKREPSGSAEADARRQITDVKPERMGALKPGVRAKALSLGGAEQNMRLGSRQAFATELQAKAQATWERKAPGNTSFVRSGDELEAFEKALKEGPQWGRAIEMDNMSRHEWPICRELGLPLRENYRDINATSDGQPSLTSQIRARALAAERVAAERAAAKAEELKKLTQAGTTFACPCGQTFRMNILLRNHRNTCTA